MTAIDNGGLTHVRYAHACRPRDLDVQCRRCGALALARKPSEVNAPLLIGDLSPSWRLADWYVTCPACAHREENLSFDELPERYWRVEVGGICVWAWNRAHLAFLAEYLDGAASQDHPYAWFGAYIPGEWKRHAGDVVRAIRARLKGAA